MVEIKLDRVFEHEFRFVLYMDKPKSCEIAAKLILDQIVLFYFHNNENAGRAFRNVIDLNLKKDACVTYCGKVILKCKIILGKKGTTFKCIGEPVSECVIRFYD